MLMTGVILYLGYFFWSGLLFFSVKAAITTRKKESVIRFFTKLCDASPVGLGIPGGLFFLLGLFCVYRQTVDIQNFVGTIGPKYQLGTILGTLGAALLSAQIFLKRD